MPIRDRWFAVVVLAAGFAACASNPDPRKRPIDVAVTDGRGGWIAASLGPRVEIEGELISVDTGAIHVMTRLGLVSLPLTQVTEARLWEWDPKIDGTVVWGSLGTVSTVSHGFFLVLSAPAWILITSVVASVESRHPILDYPDHPWPEFARWARFPQGMPPGLRPDDLLHQDRAPHGSQPAQHGPPGADTPAAGSGAGSGTGSGSGSL